MKHIDAAKDDAIASVHEMLEAHGAAAIPALIGACVLWAVENGAADVVRGTLQNAQRLATDMELARKRNLG